MASRDYEFFEDRTTYIREQLLEKTDGTWAGKALEAGTLAIRFRMYAITGTLILDSVMTKVQIAGGDYADSGSKYSGVELYARPTSAANRVICRIVVVDTATEDLSTPTDDREFVFVEWESRVRPSPQ